MGNKRRGQNELIAFIESLVKPSVVLVEFDGKTYQTGFFVSARGWVCTCFHGARFRKNIVVYWNNRRFDAHKIFSSPEQDLLLLGLTAPDDTPLQTPVMPIVLDALPTDFHHDAISIGFSGIGTFGVPPEPRLFSGSLTGKYDTETQERLKINRISKARGNSGAPVVDLQMLRAVAYVRASYNKARKVAGDALTFAPLQRAFPELADEWRAAGREFGRRIAGLYKKTNFHIDVKACPDDFVSGLVFNSAADSVERHFGNRLFRDKRYSSRTIDKELRRFLEAETSDLLLLAGSTGSGKTSVLLNLVQNLDRDDYLPIFFNCSGHKTRVLLKELFSQLLAGEVFGRSVLAELLGRCPGKTWIFVFDGLNECSEFSIEQFKTFVCDLTEISKTGDFNLKVIVSLRTEFLRENLPEIFFWRDNSADEEAAELTDLLYRDYSGQPYLDIGLINKTYFDDDKLELQLMYEKYCETGLRPTTTFDQLTPAILKMLDRPFILDLTMRSYDGREIPLRIGRSQLIRTIVTLALKNAGIGQSSAIARTEGCLSKLAVYLLNSYRELRCRETDLQCQKWYSGAEFDKLFAGTSFLERDEIRGAFGTECFVSFAADWAFEFFIARHLWGDWWNRNSDGRTAQQLSEFYALLPKGDRTAGTQHLLMSLVFFTEWALTDDTGRFGFIAAVMNDSANESFAKSFTHECLDFFRINYGFNRSDFLRPESFLSILSDQSAAFTKTGIEGILDYVEYLETIGEYENALALLKLDVFGELETNFPAVKARRYLSLALNSLLINENLNVLDYAEQVETTDLPNELIAKRAFVAGRVYQFNGEFGMARTVFRLGIDGRSLYSYKCEHQLAFIDVMSESRFSDASVLLKEIIDKPNAGVTREQKLASSLLLATCMFRMGQYAESEDQLHEIIRLRTGQRNTHRLGTALRALAEVHSRKFEHSKAVETVEISISKLEKCPPLSLASAWDTKSAILGILKGDMDGAYECVEKSLRLCDGKRHRPTNLWSLQTKALLTALDGKIEDTDRLLDRAGVGNRYEMLLRRFIRLLALHVTGENSDADYRTEIKMVQDGFRSLDLAWYPGVLSLVDYALIGKIPDSREIELLFPAGVDVKGVISSHLFARIFGGG